MRERILEACDEAASLALWVPLIVEVLHELRGAPIEAKGVGWQLPTEGLQEDEEVPQRVVVPLPGDRSDGHIGEAPGAPAPQQAREGASAGLSADAAKT